MGGHDCGRSAPLANLLTKNAERRVAARRFGNTNF
jgi:hypothetical protein